MKLQWLERTFRRWGSPDAAIALWGWKEYVDVVLQQRRDESLEKERTQMARVADMTDKEKNELLQAVRGLEAARNQMARVAEMTNKEMVLRITRKVLRMQRRSLARAFDRFCGVSKQLKTYQVKLQRALSRWKSRTLKIRFDMWLKYRYSIKYEVLEQAKQQLEQAKQQLKEDLEMARSAIEEDKGALLQGVVAELLQAVESEKCTRKKRELATTKGVERIVARLLNCCLWISFQQWCAASIQIQARLTRKTACIKGAQGFVDRQLKVLLSFALKCWWQSVKIPIWIKGLKRKAESFSARSLKVHAARCIKRWIEQMRLSRTFSKLVMRSNNYLISTCLHKLKMHVMECKNVCESVAELSKMAEDLEALLDKPTIQASPSRQVVGQRQSSTPCSGQTLEWFRAVGPVAFTGIVIALGPECCAVSPASACFNPDFVDEALAEVLSHEGKCSVSVHQVSCLIQGDLLIVMLIDSTEPRAVSSKLLSQTLMMQALDPGSYLHRRAIGTPLREVPSPVQAVTQAGSLVSTERPEQEIRERESEREREICMNAMADIDIASQAWDLEILLMNPSFRDKAR
jgi:hypothetical protein